MSLLSKVILYCLFAITFCVKPAFAQDCASLAKLLADGDVIKASELVTTLPKTTDAHCLNQIGEVYLRKGTAKKAIEYFNKALNQSDDEKTRATALNKLGLASWSIGDNNEALDYMLLSLELRKNTAEVELLAATYNDLGLVQSNTSQDAALDNYIKALDLYESSSHRDEEKIAQVKINIGVIYRSLEFFGDAMLNFNQALEISKINYPEGHPTQGFIYYNLGQTQYAMNNSENALSFYLKALDVYQNVYGEKHPDIARTYNRLGNTVNRNGEFELALNYYQKALIANSHTFDNVDIEANPPIDSYISANTLMTSIYYKAQALEDYHFNHSLDFKDLKLSLSTLYSGDSLIDNMRQVTANEADKIALGSLSSQIYENGVRISYTMADLSFKKDEYFSHAFYFAEKSKSAVLLQAISDASAKSFANLPTEELDKESYFKNEIAFYEQKLSQRSQENDELYRQALFDLKQDYHAFITDLELQYPEYYNLKYNTGIPTISDLQSVLDDQTAIISYFIADATSRIYVFEITKNKFKVENVNQTENFDRYLSGFRNSIYFKEHEVYQLTGEELYDLLFPNSLSRNIEHLVIIPAGRLGTIPFEAILTKGTKDKDFDYQTLPYLIKDYGITYQYASALYYQYAGSKSTQTANTALLCAPVEFSSLQDLPGSGEEIEQLRGIFQAQGVKPDIMLQAEASESSFKGKNLRDYRYLHLATHGVVNEYSPELSRIYLRETAGGDDGNLYSGEIYNLNLNADLVALSACETGLGKISKGEGIIGLSRALVYAGAQNIIVSLWKVADASTSQFMTTFYQTIETKSYWQSLRQAKLNMHAGKYNHPYYWAPFIMIGK